MAKTTYLGANVEITTDSFSGWINKTNQLVYDMGTVVLTAGPVAQPNTTNGAAVTGNTHVEGFSSANTLVATDALRGGTVSTPANLVVTTNTVFQQSNLIDVQANTNLLNVDANNVVISSNVTMDGGATKNFAATFGNITTTSALFDITANTFNLSSNSTVDGAILNIHTTDLDITANSTITAAALTANVTAIDVDYTTATFNGTTFTHTAQDITINSNTVSVNSTAIDVTSDAVVATLSDLTLISNTAIANVAFVDVNSTAIDVAGNTTVSGTTSTINANTTVNGTTVDVNANTTITGSNVNIVGHTTVTGTTVVTGTNLDVNANTTIDGSTIALTGNTTITGTNTDIIGSASVTGSLLDINSDATTVDGTSLTVNANTSIIGSTIGLNGDVTASGTNAIINANTTVNASNVNINGITTVVGSASFTGTDFDVAANTTVTGSTLEIAANTTITGSNTDIIGSASVTGSLLDVNASTTIDGTSFVVNANTSVTGSTVDLNSTLTITGPSMTVGSNTTFNGATVDINSATDITGATSITGPLTAIGNVSITSTNTVINSTNTNITGTGTSITTNTLNVSANTTHSGRVTVNGNAKFAGLYANVATTDLIVGANSTFTANTFTANIDTFTIGVNSADDLIVNSDATLNSTLTVVGDQLNQSDLVVQGDLTVLGNTSFSSNVTLSLAESDVQVFSVTDTFELVPGATVISNILPQATLTYDLGSSAAQWDNVYAGNFIGTLDWTNVANKPDPTISVALSGDVVGSSSATLTDLANGSISILTAIQPNSVVLGTDTTGAYVQSLVQGTGVTITNNSGEGATPTISIGQAVATTSDVTFNSVTVSEDVVVSGNLLVEGTTTTINTNEVNIGDNILLLNSDETGTPSQNAGFEIERGTSTNVSFLWDETADRWTLGSQSLVASSFIGSLSGNASTASKLQFARSITLGGALTGSATFDGSQNITINANLNSGSIILGTDTTGDYVETVAAGAGISVSGSGVGATATVSHADTSTQASVNNSNGNVIQDITLDTYGHITALGSTNLDTRYVRQTTNQTISGFKTFANTTILQSTTAGSAAAKIVKNIEDGTNTPALIVAGDGESIDVIAEFRANATGTSVDITDTPNSSDSVFQILGTGNVNADGTITAGGFTTTGTVSAGTLTGDINYNDITNPPTIGNATITISAGSGLVTGGNFTTNQTSNETITLAHADTSSITDTSTSGKNVISSLSYDGFGHVTAATTRALDFYTTSESDSRYVNASGDTITGNLTVNGLVQVGQNGGGDSIINFYDDNSNVYRTLMWDDTANDWSVEDNSGVQRTLFHSGNLPTPNDASITIATGSGLTGSGVFTLNQASNETVTVSHSDTSTLSGSYGGAGNGVVVEDITVDGFGHITSIGTVDLDTRFLGISAKAADSELLDGLNSTQFVRADANDVTTGTFQTVGLGVGTAAPTGGEIRATGDITAFYSDARLKDFKGTINNALNKVNSLNGYYYTPNETAQNLGYTNELQVGVSAQEVQAILPEIVTKAPISYEEHVEEDYLTVKYEKLIPLLIEAIKELKSEIEQLKSKG